MLADPAAAVLVMMLGALPVLAVLVAVTMPPPLDPAIDEAVRDYVERRRREGGVEG